MHHISILNITKKIIIMNRRSFLGNAAAGLAASGFITSIPTAALAMSNRKGIGMPLGFQSYVFRDGSLRNQKRR